MDTTVLSSAADMIFRKENSKAQTENASPRRAKGLRRLFASVALLVWFLLAGQAGAASVTLVWNPSPDTSVTGYRIYYGVTPGQYTNSIAVGNVTSNSVSGLVTGVTYYFATTAYDATGVQSPFSNEISFNAATSRVQVHTSSSHQLILSVQGQATHIYDIQATQDFKTWTVIGTVTAGAGGTVDFTDPNAASYASRYYRLRDKTP